MTNQKRKGDSKAAPYSLASLTLCAQCLSDGNSDDQHWETTGALDAMLAKIADFYEEEVDAAVSGMLTLIEPIMIAFLGVVVGGIVIAMYMPIFDLISRMAG